MKIAYSLPALCLQVVAKKTNSSPGTGGFVWLWAHDYVGENGGSRSLFLPLFSICCLSLSFHPLYWSSFRWCLDIGEEEEVVCLSWNEGRKEAVCLDWAMPSIARQWYISGASGAEGGPLGTLWIYPCVLSMNLASHTHMEVNSFQSFTMEVQLKTFAFNFLFFKNPDWKKKNLLLLSSVR